MAYYNIQINLSNAAFDKNPTPEVLRLLHQEIERLQHPGAIYNWHKLRDRNGNICGWAEHNDEDDDDIC
jgi:hypothetical protein